MSFNPQRLKKAFYAFSSTFKRQSAFGTALANADLDERHNCTVEFEDVVETETIYDCSGEDIHDEQVQSQLKRVTITYPSITPQRLFGWVTMLLGACAAPTGTPANEVQTITIDATGGTFPVALNNFEGKSGTTGQVAWNISAANLQAALEALDPIGEGNVTVGLVGLVYTITFIGDLAKANIPTLSTAGAVLTGGAGTATVATTTQGANKYHAATRSTDDQLPKTSIGCGYEGNATNPEKYRDLVTESVSFTTQRRKNVTAVVTLLGRFTPADMVGFTVPECENLPALKGRDCKIKVNGQYLGEEFWQSTVTLNNNTPTGDDAFPNDDVEVGNLERGDKPTYPISMQILGSKGDTIGEICRLRSKVPVEFLLGKPGNRCSVILPNVQFKFASNPRVYVGERNRSAHAIDAVPHKDATLLAPLRAEAYLDQTETFLSV
jgi:hypothetical protein